MFKTSSPKNINGTSKGDKIMTILKRNEIDMLQFILIDGICPTEEYRIKLANKLEKIKATWYKVNKKKIFAKEQERVK